MRRCRICGGRVWPRQQWGGYGPIGYGLLTAHEVWHTECAAAEAAGRAAVDSSNRDEGERHAT